MPKFSLLYTSARTHLIKGVVEDWLGKAKNPEEIEVIITVDSGVANPDNLRQLIAQYGSGAWPIRCNRLQVHTNRGPQNCVAGWNLAAENSTGDVLIAISDDFTCPQFWEEKLLELEGGAWVNRQTVIRVNDGYVKDICTLPIITRKRYENVGYFYYDSYESMFVDTDLSARAIMDRVLLDAPHLLFEHKHCDNHKRQKDEVDQKHASSDRWKRGEMLFNYRKDRAFPLDIGEKNLKRFYNREPEPIATKYAAYLQVTRDDFCLYEVCARLHEEGVNTFFFSTPKHYWSGRPVSEEEIQQIREIAGQLEKLGCTCHLRVFEVDKYRGEGIKLTETETHVRNDSVEWVLDSGFNHVLIVDGDELWRKGLLKQIDDLVLAENPSSISTGNIPVVGMPGYPIDNAQDRIVVYMRGDNRFKECRTPLGMQTNMQGYGVFHFTGTRRTTAEVVEKMRASGHYDDPDYEFEKWIEKTFPNIKSGAKDIHMYRNFQIWPSVRSWKPEEWEEIPPSLRPYLSDKAEVELKPSSPFSEPSNNKFNDKEDTTKFWGELV